MAVTTYRYNVPGNLAMENRGGTKSAYRFDARGSTTQLINTSATVTDTFQFDSFGNQVSRTGTTATPFTFMAGISMYMPSGISPVFGVFGPLRWDPKTGGFTNAGDAIAGWMLWQMWQVRLALLRAELNRLFPWGLLPGWPWLEIIGVGRGYRTPTPRVAPPIPVQPSPGPIPPPRRVSPPSNPAPRRRGPIGPRPASRTVGGRCGESDPIGAFQGFLVLFAGIAKCTIGVICDPAGWTIDAFEILWNWVVYDELPGGDACELGADIGLNRAEESFEEQFAGKVGYVGGKLLDIHCFVKTVSDAKKAAGAVPSTYVGCNYACNCDQCCADMCNQDGSYPMTKWYRCVTACTKECCPGDDAAMFPVPRNAGVQ